MQEAALKNLETLRNANINKALLISATATGKTYLSAFDVKNFKAKRILFVVHRWNIAKKAMESFMKIFKDEKHMDCMEAKLKKPILIFFSTNLVEQS